MTQAIVEAVSRSARHTFSKQPQLSIRLLTGLGVEGDAHAGETVRHRFHRRFKPHLPNLRQVHLVHVELLEELRAAGFSVGPGDIGENITARGIHLLSLPRGTRLHLGSNAIVEITGLRSPCVQIDRFRKGMLAAVVDQDAAGNVVRKSGIMGIVIAGGEIHAGDAIAVELPAGEHLPLAPV